MEKQINCCNCKELFTPKWYNFPTYQVAWHTCPDGTITGNYFKKQERIHYIKTEFRSPKEIINRKLQEFQKYGVLEKTEEETEEEELNEWGF